MFALFSEDSKNICKTEEILFTKILMIMYFSGAGVDENRLCTWVLLHDVESLDSSSSQHGRQRGRETVALT